MNPVQNSTIFNCRRWYLWINCQSSNDIIVIWTEFVCFCFAHLSIAPLLPRRSITCLLVLLSLNTIWFDLELHLITLNVHCILQSHGQSDGFEKIMRNVNIVFTTLFTIESIMKILGFGIKVNKLHQCACVFGWSEMKSRLKNTAAQYCSRSLPRIFWVPNEPTFDILMVQMSKILNKQRQLH